MFFISRIKKETTIQIIVSTLVFLFSSFIFYRIYYKSDIHVHSYFSSLYINGSKDLPGNFLYYWLISFLAGFQVSFLPYSSVLVLGSFVMAKYIVVYNVLRNSLKQKIEYSTLTAISLGLITLSSIYLPQLIFNRFYLGSVTPNIWHNSTIIAVMPFAILLFAKANEQLHQFSNKRVFLILLLVFSNAIIKPSFLFVFVAALPLTAFIIAGKFSSLYFKQISPAIFAFFLIIIQKVLIYNTENVFESKVSIIVDPFYVYNQWFGSLSYFQNLVLFTVSIFTSLVYPIFVFSQLKIKKHNSDIIFSITSMFGALLIFILFKESGSRMLHGNFMWQTFICSFILFLIAVKYSINYLAQPIRTKKTNLYQLIFTLHVVFGFVYIARLILYKSYL